MVISLLRAITDNEGNINTEGLSDFDLSTLFSMVISLLRAMTVLRSVMERQKIDSKVTRRFTCAYKGGVRGSVTGSVRTRKLPSRVLVM